MTVSASQRTLTLSHVLEKSDARTIYESLIRKPAPEASHDVPHAQDVSMLARSHSMPRLCGPLSRRWSGRETAIPAMLR